MHENTIVYQTQKDFKENVRLCTIMHQNMIVYDTQKILIKNVRICTNTYQNMIIYESQKILRKMYVHVQQCTKIGSSVRQRRF